MFITPIPAINNDIPATPAINKVNVFSTEPMIFIIPLVSITIYSPSAFLEPSSLRVFSILLIVSLTFTPFTKVILMP